MFPRRIPTVIVLLLSALLILVPTSQIQVVAQAPPPNGPGELAPRRVIQPGGISRQASGFFSPRTLRVAIDVDRDGARLRSYTLKDIPFIRPLVSQGIDAEGKNPRVEVALMDRGGKRYRRSLEVPLCFEHPGDAPPHVMGDQIQLHRDTFVLELPEVEGFDRLEITTYAARSLGGDRRTQFTETLDARRFTSAGGKSRYRDLLFVAPSQDPSLPSPSPPKPPGVIWPEDIGDTEIYRVEGNESEGLRRINVVVVPDAYLPGDKDLLITQFQSLARYPGIFPIEEHKSLVNFVLVFAYSHENGPDQCDCGIIRDTAMGTHFGDLPPPYDGCGGHSCLTYQSGGDCDVDRSGNITEALLRAPLFDQSMGDTKLLLVQSSRPGGCGVLGGGTTISANSLLPGTWHEMSHGWASLRDEYVDHTDCGGATSEINTSTNSTVGAWPEWIADLGPPHEGADHYLYCRYGPTGICLMSFGNSEPLCPVCTQRWALVFYGSPRISPTAPIESSSPPSALSTQTGVWTDFSVTTRLPTGLGIANEISWQIQGPGYPSPVTIAIGNPAIRMPFDLAGSYVLMAKVIADANLIKPVKYGPNVDTATWNVSVALGPPPLEVSPPGSTQPVTFSDDATIHWEDGAVSHSATFNLYRGTIAELSQGSFGACLAPSVPANTTSDPTQPGINEAWFYLVAGKTAGAIGPLGQDSSGASRGNGAACF